MPNGVSNDIFLSVVIVAYNQRPYLERVLKSAVDVARRCSQDYEIVVVDNGSEDDSIGLLKALCEETGFPNLQVYVLSTRVEDDYAAWAGVESALGDYVAVIDPAIDDIDALPSLLAASMDGADVVFARNSRPIRVPLVYRAFRRVFGVMVARLLRVDASREMPFFRILSREVINYMSRHNAAGLAYRLLPATSGFRKATITYDGDIPDSVARRPRRSITDELDRGTRMLVSSTIGPMRIVTLLSLFGAFMNVIYSGYVIAVAILKQDVEPGWVTLSLQQSGMFFLISLVLLVLGEYIIHMARLAANAPGYHVADEFGSAIVTHREKLNVEVRSAAVSPLSPLGATGTRGGS